MLQEMASIYKCKKDQSNLIVSGINFTSGKVYYYCPQCKQVYMLEKKKNATQ